MRELLPWPSSISAIHNRSVLSQTGVDCVWKIIIIIIIIMIHDHHESDS